MSSSHASDDDHRQAFLAYGEVDQEFAKAEQEVAAALGVQLDAGEHFGDDWVLKAEEPILTRCQRLVSSEPQPVVLQVVVLALRGSYQLKSVHRMLTDIAVITMRRWCDGDRSQAQRDVLRDVSQAYRYGVRAEDADLVLRMCDEPTIAATDEDGSEEFRAYWFDSLAKIKDPRAIELCRAIVRQDIGRWSDSRIFEALGILGKTWEPADAELVGQVAAGHSDSEVRRRASKILKRHT